MNPHEARGANSRAVEATFAVGGDGRIVHVSEVERGRACGCFCAACNSPVVARKGERNAWHFAHDTLSSCATAAETALHLAVKQVIVDGSVLGMPELTIEETATFDGQERSATRVVEEPRRASYGNPRLEVRLGDIVADAVVTVAGRDFVVEVAVTHRVDDDKVSKMREIGLAAIELLAWRLSRDVNWDQLCAFVSDSFVDRIWLHNPREPVQRRLAHLAALQHAKNAATFFGRLQAQSVASSAARVESVAASRRAQQGTVDKFMRLWEKYGTGSRVHVELDAKAAGYVDRWSENDAAGDPSAYFDLLVEWIRTQTGSTVVSGDNNS